MASPRGKKTSTAESPIRFIRRFSSIKVDFEKRKRKTLSKYSEQGLKVSTGVPSLFNDKREIQKRLRSSLNRYSLRELYVKIICALFPGMKAKEMPDSNALIQHLKQVFKFSEQEHAQLLEISRLTKLPQRIINLEIVEAREIPAKDTNGLSDPFCVVFVNSRDLAQRTIVIPSTLNPVWKQYFTFKVTDPQRDVLNIEVMDYNKDEEPLRERFRRFKEMKSPSTLGVLLKEIANARSVQELIGSLRIPVSEISSDTLERWYKLKNHEDRGEIYLRMALGFNKTKEAATEEFLQILHCLLIFELDKEASLGTPFYWDEHYEMWSKYILRTFKWQGGLKPKDIVLTKWRAYTLVNSIFPLNANMICLLLDAVLEKALSREFDARELTRFWDSTVLLVNTIVTFLTEIHDLLPCPVTVLHTYHMLKTLELLNQFLCQPKPILEAPFTKADVVGRVVKAVRDGADKFYIKVFSDSTHDPITPTEDPLILALERLLRMGQILHEDLRLALSTVHTDFKGILSIDYLAITFKVYDEQYGKMVKYIVEEYSEKLMDPNFEVESDEMQDESSVAVRTGLAVLNLYLAVKNLAGLAPGGYSKESSSEFSLKLGFHNWFFHSVATWIDILRNRIIKWVKNSVSISEGGQLGDSRECAKLSITDQQRTREIPISTSAVDSAQMFMEIHKFWINLGWEDPYQSYIIVRKILEELYGFLIYYAAELLKAIRANEAKTEQEPEQIQAYLRKASTSANNINYVKEQVEKIANQLNISKIIRRLPIERRASEEDYEGAVIGLKSKMEEQVQDVIKQIVQCCIRTVAPGYKRLLLELSISSEQKSSRECQRALIDYIDNCLITLNENLEQGNFNEMLVALWDNAMDGIDQVISFGLETGKTRDYFQAYKCQLFQLHSLFWPKEVELTLKMENPSAFEAYSDLKRRLSFLEKSVVDLKVSYYENRFIRQRSSPLTKSKHGSITIRACFVEKPDGSLIVELLNARNLRGYDKNNLSDPYAVVSVVPKERFPSAPQFTTKCHKGTVFPLFEETFQLPISLDDMGKEGFLAVTLFDYDFLGRDDLMGEAFLAFSDLRRLDSLEGLESQAQLHLVLCKPEEKPDSEILSKFEERIWDKDALKFAKGERDKMEMEK